MANTQKRTTRTSTTTSKKTVKNSRFSKPTAKATRTTASTGNTTKQKISKTTAPKTTATRKTTAFFAGSGSNFQNASFNSTAFNSGTGTFGKSTVQTSKATNVKPAKSVKSAKFAKSAPATKSGSKKSTMGKSKAQTYNTPASSTYAGYWNTTGNYAFAPATFNKAPAGNRNADRQFANKPTKSAASKSNNFACGTAAPATKTFAPANFSFSARTSNASGTSRGRNNKFNTYGATAANANTKSFANKRTNKSRKAA